MTLKLFSLSLTSRQPTRIPTLSTLSHRVFIASSWKTLIPSKSTRELWESVTWFNHRRHVLTVMEFKRSRSSHRIHWIHTITRRSTHMLTLRRCFHSQRLSQPSHHIHFKDRQTRFTATLNNILGNHRSSQQRLPTHHLRLTRQHLPSLLQRRVHSHSTRVHWNLITSIEDQRHTITSNSVSQITVTVIPFRIWTLVRRFHNLILWLI